MKNYYIGRIFDEDGEGHKVLYSAMLNEYAAETKGNIICSEEDPLAEIFGTDDKEEICKIAKLEPMRITQMIELNAELLNWVLAKEPHLKYLWYKYGNPCVALGGLMFGNDECWNSNEFFQYHINDALEVSRCYYDTVDYLDYACIDYDKPIRVEQARFDF